MTQNFLLSAVQNKLLEYDFTFEERYLIYHCNLCNELVYLAIDIETGRGVEVQRRFAKAPYKKETRNRLRKTNLSKLLARKIYPNDRWQESFKKCIWNDRRRVRKKAS